MTDAERLIGEVVEAFGTVDIVINNAGITDDTLLMRMTEEQWDRVISVNLKSCFNLTKAVMRTMLKARSGSIVNISSGAGRFGIRGLLPYCVAKGGLEALTRAMAQELAPRIRVNAIALGAFMTTGLQSSFDLMPGSEEQLLELNQVAVECQQPVVHLQLLRVHDGHVRRPDCERRY